MPQHRPLLNKPDLPEKPFPDRSKCLADRVQTVQSESSSNINKTKNIAVDRRDTSSSSSPSVPLSSDRFPPAAKTTRSGAAAFRKPVPIDLFRRKRHSARHIDTSSTGGQYKVTPKKDAEKEEEGKEEAGTDGIPDKSSSSSDEDSMWGNWSYAMSPVTLLTHLTEEFITSDDPNVSPIQARYRTGSVPFMTPEETLSAASRSAIHTSGTRSANHSRSSSPKKTGTPRRSEIEETIATETECSRSFVGAIHGGRGRDGTGEMLEKTDRSDSITESYLKIIEEEENIAPVIRRRRTNPARRYILPVQPGPDASQPQQVISFKDPFKNDESQTKTHVIVDEGVAPNEGNWDSGSEEEWQWDSVLEGLQSEGG